MSQGPVGRLRDGRYGTALATVAALTLSITVMVTGLVEGSAGAVTKKIDVVAAENEYGNVAAQIGGKYVSVTSVESNPNTDPHSYEVSPGVAEAIAAARVVIQNGVGYDAFMQKVESASPSSTREVIDVQTLLGLPDSTSNPHLWYSPSTMPAVASALATDFIQLDPSDASYFKASAARFLASLQPWLNAISDFKAAHPGVTVATTEPVADYLLQALGAHDLTPFTLQADIMNGVDASPQDVSLEETLFAKHRVKVFVYNEQVTDSLTQSFIADAKGAGVPIVGVYETMPTPGYSYQSWMLAEVDALTRAVVEHRSTTRL